MHHYCQSSFKYSFFLLLKWDNSFNRISNEKRKFKCRFNEQNVLHQMMMTYIVTFDWNKTRSKGMTSCWSAACSSYLSRSSHRFLPPTIPTLCCCAFIVNVVCMYIRFVVTNICQMLNACMFYPEINITNPPRVGLRNHGLDLPHLGPVFLLFCLIFPLSQRCVY